MTMYIPSEKIGEGKFRECFAVEGDSGLCLKRLKPNLGFFKRLYLWIMRRRLHEEEQKIYQNLPAELKRYFNPIVDISDENLLTARPLDYDGTHSRPVKDFGQISNAGFWQQIEEIVALLEKHKIWFFDVFQSGTNIFAQRLSETDWKPVIVDYKRIGWKSFPMQFNLLFDSEKRKKFYRSYQRFEDSFRAK